MEERGLLTEGLLAQCTDFKCPNKGTTNCHCHQTLFNQPNFVEVKSRLETYCNSHDVEGESQSIQLIDDPSYSYLLYRFASHTHRFMEAYETGIDGKLAMWAQKTYKGHCMPLEKDILADYNKKLPQA